MSGIDPYLFRPEPTFTGPQVADKAGLDLEFAKRLLRALGLPEVGDDVVEFDDDDVDVLRSIATLRDAGFTEDDIIQVARAYGQSLSRVADAEVRVFRTAFVEPLRAASPGEDQVVARLQEVVPTMLDMLSHQIDRVHRRHLAIALERVTGIEHGGPTEPMAVAFVDLVNFSKVSSEIETEELGNLVTAFETLAIERCTERGVRVVKVIGDAAMLAASSAEDTVDAAAAIVTELGGSDGLPDGRAGVDFGDVLPRGGDYFGHPVNVAARLVNFARPGTVVASQELLDALTNPRDVSHIGKVRLKGVGSVRAFKLNEPE
ncbi:MAG: adenylate/guanylate cyclase domain-containing protein [Actinomycetota bacterium]